MSRLILVSILSVLLLSLACAPSTRPFRYAESGAHSTSVDGLYQIQSWSLKGAVFIRPGASLAGYHGLHINPVGVAYKGGEKKAAISPRVDFDANYELSEEAMARLKRIMGEAFERALAKSEDFTGLGELGPGVLDVRIYIVDLVAMVPPERADQTNFLRQLGEMTLVAEARDPETKEVLLRLVDRRIISPASTTIGTMQATNPVTSWGAVRDLADEWSKTFRLQVETLYDYPAPPAPSPAAQP